MLALRIRSATLLFCCAFGAFAQAVPTEEASPQQIALTLAKGVPLRVIVTGKLRFRQNQPVHARLVEPLFAFDREVVPPGTEVTGTIRSLDPVDRRRRVRAILAGDFTPLHDPKIEFDALVLPNGTRIPFQNQVTPGSGAVVRFDAAKSPAKGQGQIKEKIAAARQAARDQIGERKRAVIAAVKTPGKLELLGDALLARLPWHPQFWPAGTRLNAQLLAPLEFGIASVPLAQLSQLGAEPGADSLVHARLVTDLNSRTAAKGMAVEALLSQPLFSEGHQLLFPEGSRLLGTVVQARAARFWHRSGQLRFAFQNIEPPVFADRNTRTALRVEGQLESAEINSQEKLAMDAEGGTETAPSRKRFIAPVLTLMLAGRGLDREHVRLNGARTGEVESNAGGQATAGAVGFGLIGAALGQISPPVSAVIGFYGAGWSVYSNIIGRGQEVHFPTDTSIEVRLGTRIDRPKQ